MSTPQKPLTTDEWANLPQVRTYLDMDECTGNFSETSATAELVRRFYVAIGSPELEVIEEEEEIVDMEAIENLQETELVEE